MSRERPIPRRGLRRTEAATYVGLSASKFDQLVRDGRMPEGFAIDGCTVWDVLELDFAFDNLKVTPKRVEEFDRL